MTARSPSEAERGRAESADQARGRRRLAPERPTAAPTGRGQPARRVPRRPAAARGRLRQLPQARRPRAARQLRRARERAAGRRAPARARRSRAGARGGRAARGGASSRRASRSSIARSRRARAEGLEEIATDGPFDPHVHEALLGAAVRGASEGIDLEVVQRGYRSATGVLRPARVVVAAATLRGGIDDGPQGDLYETLGVPTRRHRGRDQEGLPQARARAPPGRQPGRQGRRGALQGGPERLRRPLRPREAQAVRHVRRRNGRAGGGGGAGRRPLRATFDLGDLGDLLRRRLRRRARRPRRRRGRAPMRGADLEVDASTLSFEDSLRGAETRVPVEVDAACRDLRRHGRRARHRAHDLPRVQRPRRRSSESQGLFALSQPCPRCRGNGIDHREAVPDLPRHRPRAAHASATRSRSRPGSRTARGSGSRARASRG